MLTDTTRVTQLFSFQTSTGFSNVLDLWMFKYNIDGTFMGSEVLTTQLQLCRTNFNDGVDFKTFGSNFYNDCNFDLNSLLSSEIET
mmetsp:Transcript_98288/g.211963  ORF Transcript_98288/g.211963 Transcript_98288/m.211963 type:complete len:86 (-) Transcript_98288:2015-2272(-)